MDAPADGAATEHATGAFGEAVPALKVAICVRRGEGQADAGFTVLEAGAQAEVLGLIARTAATAFVLRKSSAVTWSEVYPLPDALSQLDALLSAIRHQQQPAAASEAEPEAPRGQPPTTSTMQTEAPREQPRTASDSS